MTFKLLRDINASQAPWGNYDFGKPSLAVVAASENGDTAAILWAAGGHILLQIEEYGLHTLDELGIDDPPDAGIWVWEGKFRWFSSSWEYPSEQDSEAAGEYRRPTEAEWEAIKRGECPWDDKGFV